MEQWFKLKSNFTAVYKMDDTITPVQKFTHNVRVEVQTKREEGTKFKERLATMHLEFKGIFFIFACTEFYGPVNTIKVMSSQ